jgi:hypothetical protein
VTRQPYQRPPGASRSRAVGEAVTLGVVGFVLAVVVVLAIIGGHDLMVDLP